MGVSLNQLLVILLIILMLFGTGRLPKIMEELGKGLKAFRNGLKDDTQSKKYQIDDQKNDNVE